jgi:hypothetical protein
MTVSNQVGSLLGRVVMPFRSMFSPRFPDRMPYDLAVLLV